MGLQEPIIIRMLAKHTYARVARDVLLIAIHMLQITPLFLVTLHHRYPAVMLLMTMLTSRPRQCAAHVAHEPNLAGAKRIEKNPNLASLLG